MSLFCYTCVTNYNMLAMEDNSVVTFIKNSRGYLAVTPCLYHSRKKLERFLWEPHHWKLLSLHVIVSGKFLCTTMDLATLSFHCFLYPVQTTTWNNSLVLLKWNFELFDIEDLVLGFSSQMWQLQRYWNAILFAKKRKIFYVNLNWAYIVNWKFLTKILMIVIQNE